MILLIIFRPHAMVIFSDDDFAKAHYLRDIRSECICRLSFPSHTMVIFSHGDI